MSKYMFQRILDKFKRHKQKHSFRDYSYKVIKINLEKEGPIEYARWDHPFYNTDEITQQRVDFYKQFVKPGDLVIDIGAHEGDTTVPMALAAGPSGTVLALEPNPHVFPVLSANAKLNKDRTNIIPLNFAATAHDGVFTFGSGDASYGNGGIVGYSTNTARNNRYTFEVDGKNLDAYLNTHYPSQLKSLSLIKTDAEGYDKEILKNLKNILRAYRPYVISECFKQLTVEEREDLYNTFSEQDYLVKYLPDFSPNSAQLISKEQMFDRKHFDILAIPKEKA